MSKFTLIKKLSEKFIFKNALLFSTKFYEVFIFDLKKISIFNFKNLFNSLFNSFYNYILFNILGMA